MALRLAFHDMSFFTSFYVFSVANSHVLVLMQSAKSICIWICKDKLIADTIQSI